MERIKLDGFSAEQIKSTAENSFLAYYDEDGLVVSAAKNEAKIDKNHRGNIKRGSINLFF
jgi:hypothetical protein